MLDKVFKTNSQVRPKKKKTNQSPRSLKQRNKTKMTGKVDKAGIYEVFRPGRNSKDITMNKS